MFAAVGDLVEDVVVRLHEQVNVASDTRATVIRRRGGSAANAVAAAGRAGATARFIGQVGDDPLGRSLTAELAADGADLAVRRAGRTGTIIVMVDALGERTMLTDRAACTALAEPEPAWLADVATLHIPLYSLVGEPLASSVRTLARWQRERGGNVAVDLSSAAILEQLGRDAVMDLLRELDATVLFANELEAACMGELLDPANLGGAPIWVKQGRGPVILKVADASPVEIPAIAVADVTDTTGAGDAFAAGVLIGIEQGDDFVQATRRGHELGAAAVELASRTLHAG
ncbi:MAG: PfkB family carbohydrate kinase [Ilumatobacteraceae bacterium]